MVDLQTVCCMCGDIGFPDKLFRCNNCRSRFQHSYCSNYYSESAEGIEVCDWCQCEGKINSKHSRMTSKKSKTRGGSMNRCEYSGDKIKNIEIENNNSSSTADKPKNSPSPRPTTRRYKLLKDVMS